MKGKLTKAEIGALVSATHHEPRSLLGYHEFARAEGTPLCMVRVLEPGAESIEVFWEDEPGARCYPLKPRARRGPLRRQHSASPAAGAVQVAGPLLGRPRGHQARHLFLLARALGLRSLSIRRGPSLRPLPQVRRAPARARGRRGHALRGLGAERQARERGRRLQSLGRPQARHAGARRLGCVGAVRAGHRRGRGPTSTRSARSATTSCSSPIPSASTCRCGRRRLRSSPTLDGYEWNDAEWLQRPRAAPTGAVRRSMSTKCISRAGNTPGIASRRSTTGAKRPTR